MIFANPLWFWLAAALLVPLLIHLWNRKSGKPRLLGTFRFLPEEAFASENRIELHEIPLLLLRMGIVALLVLLLAGLMWETESEGGGLITISETTDGQPLWKENDDGSRTVEIPSREIDEKGWWNILAQAEHEYQPGRIIAEGDFSEHRFGEVRPRLVTDIEWQVSDSLVKNEERLAVWKSAGGDYRALVQRRTDTGIIAGMERVQISENESPEVPFADSMKMILNPDNSEEINAGLQYAADLWQVETEQQPIAETARLISGENVWSLSQNVREEGVADIAEPNELFGIKLLVEQMDTSLQSQKEIVTGRNHHLPFLSADDEENLIVNGVAERDIQSWVFAALGNRLMLNALGVYEFLSPELAEAQRNPGMLTGSAGSQKPKKQKPAKLWLAGLLVLFWLAERCLAPGRGM